MINSLKNRITIVVSLLVTVLIMITAFASLSYFEREYRGVISRYQTSVAAGIADSIDGKLRDATNALTLLAANITSNDISTPSTIERFFSKHPFTAQQFDNGMFILSREGSFLGGSATEPQRLGNDYSSLSYFRRTVESGKPQISEPIISAQKGKHPIIVFTAPVFDGGGMLIAVLCGSLDLTKSNFLGVLGDSRYGENGFIYLYDRSRTYIVHRDRGKILRRDVAPGANVLFDLALKGVERTGETTNADGLRTLTSFKLLKNADWILSVNLPSTEAYAPVLRAKNYLFLILLAVVALSILMTRFVMGRLTSPLISLSAKVRDMAVEHNANAMIQVEESASEEISTLCKAFNNMIGEMVRRKNAERSQLDFLNIMLETMPNPVFFKDKEGRYLGCNKALENLLGVARHDLVGKTVFDLLPLEIARKHANADEKILCGNDSQVYESQLQLADGKMHDLLFYKAVFPGEDGSPGGIVGSIIDISERRRAEFELAEHAEFAVNLVQNSTVPTFVLDNKHCVIIWNRACEELTGVRAYHMIGSNRVGEVFYGHVRPVLADFIIDGNLDDLENSYSSHSRSKLIPNGIHAERWFPDLNGKERYISFTAAPIENSNGELVAVIQTLEDSTERKLALEWLRESENRMRAILDTAADGIITLEADGIIDSVNFSCEAMFGYSADELTGHSISLIIPSLKRTGERLECCNSVNNKGTKGVRCETEGRRGNGSTFPVEIAMSEFTLGTRLITTCIVTDITERRRSQEDMERTLSLLAATLESTADGIMVADGSGRVVSCNRRFVEMWRLPQGVMEPDIEHDLLTLLSEQMVDPAQFLRTVDELNTEPGAESHDILELADGRIFERYSKPQMIGDAIIGRVWSYREVTEQRKLEIQLRHSQKMEALGTLAGGVAHDFNNMLTAIIGFASLVKMNMESSNPNLLYINQVLVAAERATGLTQSLLAYSRREPIDPGRLDLNDIVRKVVKLLSRLIGEDIELVISLAERELAIMADRGQVEQVLMNLATNARDAMPGKGRLVITTETVELGEEFVRGHGYGVPGPFVHISVADSGEGMDRSTMERIFEPFFTTKQMGRGTGLGLSIVYGIIKQHNGYIVVSSEIGKGSCFDIYFPRVKSVDIEVSEVETAKIEGGTETVLVVEDSPEIRYLLNQLLSASGYRVIEAVDGQDGVEKFMAYRSDVRLLLLDVIMPRKNGKEAYDEILAMAPEVKAIFISGYTAEIMSREGIGGGEYNFISKPLAPEAVLRKVRSVLDS